MSKAGKGSEVGFEHPSPEKIPHSVPNKDPIPGKESSLVHEAKEEKE
jgi:hypothetical protein